MTENAIEITGLGRTYRPSGGQGPNTALHSIDLAIPAGSIFGLLGPNGAGKSTLINILAGLVIKTSGTVSIWGFDQDVNPRQSRAAIGVMPQELNLDPYFTPRDALDLQAGLYGVPKSERMTDEVLRLVGLEDKAGAYARSLSGGMQRRLLLGKALVHRPQILVLDEPTAGVDIELRQMLWANVRRLNAEGLTVILTTHYLEEAEEMCDEIAIIDQGRLIARDKTATLIGQMDAKTLVILPEDAPGEITLPEGATLTRENDGTLNIGYRRSELTADQILQALRDAGVVIRDVSTRDPALQDVFLNLTGSNAA